MKKLSIKVSFKDVVESSLGQNIINTCINTYNIGIFIGEKNIFMSAVLDGGKLFEFSANVGLTWSFSPLVGASVMVNLGSIDAAITFRYFSEVEVKRVCDFEVKNISISTVLDGGKLFEFSANVGLT
ncbi:hypothetical protein A2U01_0003652 [Trifolium medium]|uniref:Uncharacterized protein n=1 Tax=Trifolium medium TaxID=97028 RepID=A0A392M608_9FABA|nr:hypothetical protein [Trifolium medium]